MAGAFHVGLGDVQVEVAVDLDVGLEDDVDERRHHLRLVQVDQRHAQLALNVQRQIGRQLRRRGPVQVVLVGDVAVEHQAAVGRQDLLDRALVQLPTGPPAETSAAPAHLDDVQVLLGEDLQLQQQVEVFHGEVVRAAVQGVGQCLAGAVQVAVGVVDARNVGRQFDPLLAALRLRPAQHRQTGAQQLLVRPDRNQQLAPSTQSPME